VTALRAYERTVFTCGGWLQAAAAFAANNETMGNALEKLSEELYSSDVHFVLELVQVGMFSICEMLVVLTAAASIARVQVMMPPA
jgi:hypothetical protein